MDMQLTAGHLFHTLKEKLEKNPALKDSIVVVKVYDVDDDTMGEGIGDTAWFVRDTLPGADVMGEGQAIFEITAKAPPEKEDGGILQMLIDRGYGELVENALEEHDDAVS